MVPTIAMDVTPALVPLAWAAAAVVLGGLGAILAGAVRDRPRRPAPAACPERVSSADPGRRAA